MIKWIVEIIMVVLFASNCHAISLLDNDKFEIGLREKTDFSSEINNSNVELLQMYTTHGKWKNIELTNNSFNWTGIDDKLAQYPDKKFYLRFTHCGYFRTQNDTPQWLYDAGVPIMHSIYNESGNIFCPVIWDDTFLVEWKELIRAVGNRYNNNDQIHHIEMAGFGGWGGETYIPTYSYSNDLSINDTTSNTKFRTWLENKYTTISNLNGNWTGCGTSEYNNFDEIITFDLNKTIATNMSHNNINAYGYGYTHTCFRDVYDFTRETWLSSIETIVDEYNTSFTNKPLVLMINNANGGGMGASVSDYLYNKYTNTEGYNIYFQENGGSETADSSMNWRIYRTYMNDIIKITEEGATIPPIDKSQQYEYISRMILNGYNMYSADHRLYTEYGLKEFIDGLTNIPIYRYKVKNRVAFLSDLNGTSEMYPQGMHEQVNSQFYKSSSGDIYMDIVSTVNMSYLDNYNMLIVPSFKLTNTQINTINTWVNGTTEGNKRILLMMGCGYFSSNTTNWGMILSNCWTTSEWSLWNNTFDLGFTSNVNSHIYDTKPNSNDLTVFETLNLSYHNRWINKSGSNNWMSKLNYDYFGNSTQNSSYFMGLNKSYGEGMLIHITPHWITDRTQIGDLILSIGKEYNIDIFTRNSANFSQSGMTFLRDENYTQYENEEKGYAFGYTSTYHTHTIIWDIARDSWNAINHTFINKSSSISSITTNDSFFVMWSGEYSYFNLTQNKDTGLYDTSSNIIDSDVPTQETTITSPQIKFNSSQDYNNTNWKIYLSGNKPRNSWKYKADKDSSWTTIPSANISYDGTYTLFDLKNINVSNTGINELEGYEDRAGCLYSSGDYTINMSLNCGYVNGTINTGNDEINTINDGEIWFNDFHATTTQLTISSGTLALGSNSRIAIGG